MYDLHLCATEIPEPKWINIFAVMLNRINQRMSSEFFLLMFFFFSTKIDFWSVLNYVSIFHLGFRFQIVVSIHFLLNL